MSRCRNSVADASMAKCTGIATQTRRCACPIEALVMAMTAHIGRAVVGKISATATIVAHHMSRHAILETSWHLIQSQVLSSPSAWRSTCLGFGTRSYCPASASDAHRHILHLIVSQNKFTHQANLQGIYTSYKAQSLVLCAHLCKTSCCQCATYVAYLHLWIYTLEHWGVFQHVWNNHKSATRIKVSSAFQSSNDSWDYEDLCTCLLIEMQGRISNCGHVDTCSVQPAASLSIPDATSPNKDMFQVRYSAILQNKRCLAAA